MANHNEYRVMSATVPPDLLQRVRERARLEDRSFAAVVRLALAKYLADAGETDHANGRRDVLGASGR